MTLNKLVLQHLLKKGLPWECHFSWPEGLDEAVLTVFVKWDADDDWEEIRLRITLDV